MNDVVDQRKIDLDFVCFVVVAGRKMPLLGLLMKMNNNYEFYYDCGDIDSCCYYCDDCCWTLCAAAVVLLCFVLTRQNKPPRKHKNTTKLCRLDILQNFV